MKAVVIGGCGAMGSEATRDLSMTGDFDEITIADLNLARAEAFAGELNAATGRDNVRAVRVDGSDEDALAAVMTGQDVVVNTMTFHYGIHATHAAIRTGARYVDLGGLHNTPKQLALWTTGRRMRSPPRAPPLRRWLALMEWRIHKGPPQRQNHRDSRKEEIVAPEKQPITV